MIKFILTYVFILTCNICFAQNDIINIAKLLTIADFEEFSNAKDLELTNNRIEVEYLKSKGFKNIDFIKVKVRNINMLKAYFNHFYLGNKTDNLLVLDSIKYNQEFVKQYDKIFLNDINFYEQIIGKEKFINNKLRFQGDFIFAHIKAENKLLRLKGFRINEASYFFYYFLLNSRQNLDLNFVGIKPKIRESYIWDNIEIEEIDKEYLRKIVKKRCDIIDKKSCFERDKFIIINGVGNIY